MPDAKAPSERKARKLPVVAAKGGPTLSRRKKLLKSRSAGEATESVSNAGAITPPAIDGTGSGRKRVRRKAKRLAPRKTFLVAATLPDGTVEAGLHVYAVVMRSPAEALSAVRDWLGDGVQVELTGKLSGRMSKILGLRPDEIRRF